jgi:hypothetical protein
MACLFSPIASSSNLHFVFLDCAWKFSSTSSSHEQTQPNQLDAKKHVFGTFEKHPQKCRKFAQPDYIGKGWRCEMIHDS